MRIANGPNAPQKWLLGAWSVVVPLLLVQTAIAYQQLHETMPFYARGGTSWH
jgi:hypothetical protein